MLSKLGQVTDYLAVIFLVVLACLGIYYQVRVFFNREGREAKGAKYQEFTTTIALLQNRMDASQEEIDDLKGKVKVLEERNRELLGDIALYNEKANHYLALFCTRCPYESLKDGKGYCDYFHPVDKKRIREQIMAKVNLESPDIEVDDIPTEV